MCENPGSRANLAVRFTNQGQAGVEDEGIGETLEDLEPYLPIVRRMFEATPPLYGEDALRVLQDLKNRASDEEIRRRKAEAKRFLAEVSRPKTPCTAVTGTCLLTKRHRSLLDTCNQNTTSLEYAWKDYMLISTGRCGHTVKL